MSGWPVSTISNLCPIDPNPDSLQSVRDKSLLDLTSHSTQGQPVKLGNISSFFRCCLKFASNFTEPFIYFSGLDCFTLHTVICIWTLHSEKWTMHSAYCTLHSVLTHCKLCTVHCTLYLHTTNYTLHSVLTHCKLCTVHCKLKTAIFPSLNVTGLLTQ